MLIDDNKIDLFISQRIIEKYNPTIKTKIFDDAISAVCFLKVLELNSNEIKTRVIPNVIFLDVNMPEMDGFQFFEEFKRINLVGKEKIEVYMLSSSICPDDIQKARKEPYCSGYISKPLTIDKLYSALQNSNDLEHQSEFKKII